ncbi:hypothetical protein AB0284_04510 [Pseudarthrobacter phenanthrenivorans]|uniref:hypothetical protein n=1 Tax=Pseudarthrobacter phenanthrenivorans TaxID=361575 RepID=UPI00344EC6CB
MLINALVEVRLRGQVLRTGFVEEAMPDSSAVWIAADRHGSRQMYEVCQGHEVWVIPQELCGTLTYRMTTKQMFGTDISERDTAIGTVGPVLP